MCFWFEVEYFRNKIQQLWDNYALASDKRKGFISTVTVTSIHANLKKNIESYVHYTLQNIFSLILHSVKWQPW